MSAEGVIRASEIGSLRRGRLTYLPVAPGRMEFAELVRRRIQAVRPEVVAVELPAWLESHYREAVERLPQMSVILIREEGEEERGEYVVVEPADPFVEAVRSALEAGAELVFIEPPGERPHLPDLYPDSAALLSIAYDKFVEAYRLQPQPRDDEIEELAAAMAYRLQGLDPTRESLAVLSLNLLDAVLDAMERPQKPPRPAPLLKAELLNPHPDCLAEIAQEFPYLQERYEVQRGALWREEGQPLLDRRAVHRGLLAEAETNYQAQTGECVAPWQRRLMRQFSQRLACVDHQLAPSLFDLTLAARGIVDDNFAWEVWHAAGQYQWQREFGPLETVNLNAEDVFLFSRKVRLRRRMKRPKQRLLPRGLKKRPKERYAGEWARQVGGDAICSYPPEDIVIEDYGKILRERARTLLGEERAHAEPFTTSLLDGVDIRETVRNWLQGRIYVRQSRHVSGDAGAVVVIFDEDAANRYTWLTTWLGEHENESDMAYYSTQPFEHLVGPGIGRAEYGGFLMTLPPRRLYDVWSDPDYDFAESKAERLLLAALDYSLERHVVYAAARPPRSIYRSIAAHLGRQIVYIPLGQLSPAKLKKIRVVHVLDSHQRRKIAPRYLW